MSEWLKSDDSGSLRHFGSLAALVKADLRMQLAKCTARCTDRSDHAK